MFYPLPKMPTGSELYALAKRFYPINRSITGNGVRRSLDLLEEIAGPITRLEIPSGTTVLDWTVPDEWNVSEAYIITPNGDRICDFANHKLHLMGYSVPVDKTVSLSELNQHLHSLPDRPKEIVYATSYYKRDWGFCIPHKERERLTEGAYHVVIKSTLAPGHLTIGEIRIPGETEQEIFITTYTCHPQLANNETSGPVVTAHLAKWINRLPRRKYSYRIVFAPETIGAITYLATNLNQLKKNVVAGLNITCIGDDRIHSYIAPRIPDTLIERTVQTVLEQMTDKHLSYDYQDRGSDERQYCAPGVDLPLLSLMRTRFGTYPEYHTSADDLTVISPNGLRGGFESVSRSIWVLEHNAKPVTTVLGEPQLGKRGLYHTDPSSAQRHRSPRVHLIRNLLSYADGDRDLLELAGYFGVDYMDLLETAYELEQNGLLKLLPCDGGAGLNRHQQENNLGRNE